MVSRWLAFLIWALVAGSAVAWLLRMSASPKPVPASAVAVDTAASARKDWTRLFGAPAPDAVALESAPSPLSSRFKLIGLVVPRSPSTASQGLALIAVDGRPARAYRVGAAVDGDLIVLGVQGRQVEVGPAGSAPAVTLELPPLAAAATGNLPPASRVGAPAPATPVGPPAVPADAAPPPSDAPGGVPPSQLPGNSPLPPAVPPVLQPMPVPQPGASGTPIS